ncbi:MAG: hypothetical protein ACJAY8_001024 [Sphingobacteriales bacterium]|jgi:hypothetical protein
MNRSKNIKRRTKQLAIWNILWTASMAIAAFGPTFLWKGETWISAISILINFGLGLGLIRAQIQHIKILDELQRKIQMEALGIALGIGIVGGLSYSLLDIANVSPFDAEISFLIMAIYISYITTLVYLRKKYQ